MPNPIAITNRKTVRIHCAAKRSSIPLLDLRRFYEPLIWKTTVSVSLRANSRLLAVRRWHGVKTVRPPTLLLRGFLLRCPRCGGAKLFSGWFKPPDPCPACGLSFNRDNDATVGWIIVNLGVTEIVFVALALAVLLVTWPAVPWTGLTVVAVAVNGLLPLLLVPFSRTVWAAIELLMDRMDGPPASP
jgi:uncharacterized protein (DUF983 family)